MKHTNKAVSILIAASFLFTLVLTSCKKNDSNSGNGSTAFKVTDAAIDDAAVSGAYITITDIKLDGISVGGFTKTTINIAAYQNGSTKTIGNFDLQGKTYSNVTFVLDYNTDVNGQTPGSYVLTGDGTKHKLQSTSNEIVVSKSFAIQSSVSNSLVADFDLRKMIIHQSGSTTDQYDLVTNAELQNSIRVVVEAKTGIISGILTDMVSGSDRVVAYVYKKGTYNRVTEMQGQGTSSIQFKNAVSSSLVSGRGEYKLNFLESGAYEVHFASYKDINADGQFELAGTLVVVASDGLDLLNLSVGANATVNINATASGILP